MNFFFPSLIFIPTLVWFNMEKEVNRKPLESLHVLMKIITRCEMMEAHNELGKVRNRQNKKRQKKFPFAIVVI
ncbi:CLUMA_CG016713, isoform A [Clunio marinus]|uniref:CLUMA_CG016713, isoform A n=1 Tax=Clunio marinus TaxID=568069 RepID=A0A1J1IUA2_9DIPT|nr:CLUMA_CG016713, isoform A [Clunio marinus]